MCIVPRSLFPLFATPFPCTRTGLEQTGTPHPGRPPKPHRHLVYFSQTGPGGHPSSEQEYFHLQERRHG